MDTLGDFLAECCLTTPEAEVNPGEQCTVRAGELYKALPPLVRTSRGLCDLSDKVWHGARRARDCPKGRIAGEFTTTVSDFEPPAWRGQLTLVENFPVCAISRARLRPVQENRPQPSSVHSQANRAQNAAARGASGAGAWGGLSNEPRQASEWHRRRGSWSTFEWLHIRQSRSFQIDGSTNRATEITQLATFFLAAT